MAKNIQIRVNTGNEETNKTFDIVEGGGAKGKPTVIKAVKGARYQLEDLNAKNTGPENIRSKRVGKNLHVMFEGRNEADLIVENYYDEGMLTESNRGLYGRAEDGKLYDYIPEDPTPEGMPINLADGGRPVSQVLGGTGIEEAFVLSALPLAAGGFNWLAAGLAGGAAAAAGGGGGGGGAGVQPVTPVTPIAKPSMKATDDEGANSGIITNGSVTDDTKPTFAGKTSPGAKVVIKEGNTIIGETTADANGNWSITPQTPLANGKHTFTSTVSDSTGSSTSDPLTFTIEPTNQAAEKISITLDPLTGDNIFSPTELAQTNTDLTGKVTGAFVPGDIVTAYVNGKTYTTTVKADGSYLVSIPTSDIKADEDKTIEIGVVATDPVTGKTHITNNSQTYSLEATAGTGTALSVDPISPDNILSAAESVNANTTVTGKVTGVFAAGDTVTLTVNNKTFATNVKADGTYSVDIPNKDLILDSDTQIDATISATTSTGKVDFKAIQNYAVDLTPAATNVSVTVDPITGDNILSPTDLANPNVDLTGKVTGAFTPGDVVTAYVNGKAYPVTVGPDGAYKISVPVAELKADTDKKVEITVAATDPVTGKVTVTDNSQSYAVEPTAGTGTALSVDPVSPDNLINAAESGKANTTVTGKVTGVFAAGDTVTLTVNNKPYTGTVKADGSYSVDIPTKELILDSNTQIDATISATTSAGKVEFKAVQNYALDLNPAATNVAATLDPLTGDNILSPTDLAKAKIDLTGIVTGHFTPGDKVTAYVNGKPYETTVDKDGKYTLSVPTAEIKADQDKTIEISVVATDPVTGKATVVTNSQTYAVETTAGTGTALSIDPVSPDNLINAAESGNANTTVTGKVTGVFAAGDTVTLKVNGSEYTGQVDVNGNFSVPVPTTELILDSDTQIDATVSATTSAGKVDFKAIQNYGLDITPSPISDKTALILNPISGDNIVTVTEGGEAQALMTGKVTGSFAAGDIVFIKINDKTFKGAVNADGNYSIAVPMLDLKSDIDSTVQAEIAATSISGIQIATAQQDYVVETADKAGKQTALNLAPVATDNLISGSENTGNIAITGVVTGKFAAGDVVSLHVNDRIVTGNVAANGTFSIDVAASDLVSDKDTQIEATITGSGGTTARALQNYAVDIAAPNGGVAPALSIDTDGNNDGWLNRSELVSNGVTDPTVNVSASFDSTKVEVGDKVIFTFADGSQKTVILDAAAIAAGKVTVKVSTPAEGQSLFIKAAIQDRAGNATPEATDTAKVDTSNFGPDSNAANADKNIAIEITSDLEANGGNGVLSVTELVGNKINVKVTLSADAKAGDILIVEGTGNDTQTITLSLDQVVAKAATTTFNAPANGTKFVTTAQLVDLAQNTSSKVSDNAVINTNQAGAPSVQILEDADKNGYVNKAELSGNVDVKVTAPSNAVVGDTITITDGVSAPQTFVLTQAQIDNGITASFAPPKDGSTINITSTHKATGGNAPSNVVSAPGTASATLDLTDFSKADPLDPTKRISAVGVNIDTDAGGSGDGVISAAELADTSKKIKVTVTLPAGAAVGDTLTVNASGNVPIVHILTQADIVAKQFVITDYNSVGDNQTFTVTASIKDAAGNASPMPDTSDSALMRTIISGAPVVVITEDANNDGLISKAELNNATVGINIAIPTAAKVGDRLVVVINGESETVVLNAAQLSDGSITREVTPVDGKSINVTAQLIDSGNQASQIGTDTATVDTTLPNGGVALDLKIDTDANNDGWLNRNELVINGVTRPTVSASASFDKATVDVGDKVIFTLTDGSLQTVTIDAAAKAAGKVALIVATPAEDENILIKAVLQDKAGNTTPEATDTARVDTSNFVDTDKKLEIEITSDVGNNAVLSKTELSIVDGYAGKIDVKITLSPEAKAGDTLIVEGTGNNAQTITLSAEQVAAKTVLTTFTPPANGTNFVVTAQLSDLAKNISAKVSDSAMIDTSLPGSPVVQILEDVDNNGYINKAELNGQIDVKVNAPAGAVVGDKIIVTDGVGTPQTFTLTQAQIDGGITTSFAAPVDGTTFNVSATLTPSATNIVSAAGTDSAKLDLTDFSKVDPLDSTKRVTAVSVNIDTDATGIGEGVITAAELAATGNKIKVTVTLPGGAAVGDTLTVNASGNAPIVHTLTQADVDAKKYVITDYSSVGDNQTFEVTAGIKDAAGNASPMPDATDKALMRTIIAGAPVVVITEDGNNNTFISASELKDTVGVTITIPTAAKAGDTMIVTINGVEEEIFLTPALILASSISKEVTAQDGLTITVTAQLKDTGGQLSAVGSDTATLDTTPITVAVTRAGGATLTEGGSEVITFTLSEVSSDFTWNGTTGDITVTGGTLSALIQSNTDPKVYKATFTPATNSTGTANIGVLNGKFSDAAGNLNLDTYDTSATASAVVEANNQVSIGYDTVGNRTATIDIVSISPDTGASSTDFITNQQVLKYTGTITGWKDGLGDRVMLQFTDTNTNVVTTAYVTPNSTGAWVWQDASHNAGTHSLKATIVSATGITAINSAVPTGTNGLLTNGGYDVQTVVIDTSVPSPSEINLAVSIMTDADSNGYVNKAELGTSTTFTSKATFDKTLAKVGMKITLSDGTTTTPLTLTQADIDNGYVTTTFAKPLEGATQTVTAKVTDLSNNVGTLTVSDTATLDITTISVAVTRATTNTLAKGGSELITFTLSEESSDFSWNGTTGDITVTGGTLSALTKSTTNPKIYTATFTPTSDASGMATIGVLNGKFSDAAGNLNVDTYVAGTGYEANNQVNVVYDTAPPTQTVAFTSMTKDSGVYNSVTNNWLTNDTSAGRLVSGTLSAALASGEVLQVSSNGVLIGNATVAANGTTWTITDVKDYGTSATWNYTAKVVDAVNNLGAEASRLVSTDLVEGAPAITGVTDSANTYIGNGGSANNIIKTVTGTGVAGDVVYLYDNSYTNILGSTTVADNNSWSVTGLNLSGANTFAAKQLDAQGNQSLMSGLYSVSGSLVANGDFSSGNTGFSTSLPDTGSTNPITVGSGGAYAGGSYSVGNWVKTNTTSTPSARNGSYSANSGSGSWSTDYVGGGSANNTTIGNPDGTMTGNVLHGQVNRTTSERIWESSVSVEAGKTYTFKMDYINYHFRTFGGNQQMNMGIDGFNIYFVSNDFESGHFSATYTATQNKNIVLQLISAGAGNDGDGDFWLDNFSFTDNNPASSNTLVAGSTQGTPNKDSITYTSNTGAIDTLANNDTITSNSTGLQATLAAGGHINGGAGIDNLKLVAGTQLNLEALTSNQTVKSIEQVEMITMQGSSTLTMSANDVLSLGTANMSPYAFSTTTQATGATGSTTSTGRVQFLVNGKSGDTLNLDGLFNDGVVSSNGASSGLLGNTGLKGSWAYKGTTTVAAGTAIDGVVHTYKVYDHSTTGAQVLVDQTVTINTSTATNEAPVLNAVGYALPITPRSGTTPTGATVGMLVSALVGTNITDADSTTAAEGVAITYVDTSRGSLWYSTNGGTNWTKVTAAISGTNALLLASDADNRIFFQSTTSSTTTMNYALKFRAWDKTTGTEGSTADTSVNGGSSAFSSNEAWVSQAVLPVVIDLNRDGALTYGSVAMDVDGDGHLDQTAWAGAQDGVLVWDKLGDGKVHNNSQYAFSQYGAAGSTDLQGLAAGFDTNHDGVLDAKDAKFAEFKVWQDANQNGVSDAGEVRSLSEAGITSINLVSDGVVRNPVDGVTEAGQSSAALADGSSMLVSDAGFAYSALSYSANTVAGMGTQIDLLGSNMHLDLSSIVAVHSHVSAVDLTGTGANSLKLNLSDVLGTAATNGVHTLTLTGDANDTVNLDMSHWANSGTTVTQGDHTYAVYNANASAAAQLLIDQHMVLASHG
jgi:co-chaperonin GroES (HSP10)